LAAALADLASSCAEVIPEIINSIEAENNIILSFIINSSSP
jgi:hypothetical protein